MIDQYFTPEEIAISLFGDTNFETIKTVADFSVGDGSLLQALPLQEQQVFGLDLDPQIIKKLRNKHPNWTLRTGNFINPSSQIEDWLSNIGGIDLIVLNPPFSCRGGTFFEVEVEGRIVQCRTAMAFVVRALSHLAFSGRLVAILPLSCLKADLDKKLIEFLKTNWDITIGRKLDRNTFDNCNPNSVIVSFSPKQNVTCQNSLPKSSCLELSSEIELVRGAVQMHTSLISGKFKLIHTSNLKHNRLEKNNVKFTNKSYSFVSGCFICFPRVGLPDKRKIVIVKTKKRYVLSDCVFAIRALDMNGALLLKKIIFENWAKFSALYESTCAPYITIKQIECFFASHEFKIKKVRHFTDTFSPRRLKIHLDTCVSVNY